MDACALDVLCVLLYHCFAPDAAGGIHLPLMQECYSERSSHCTEFNVLYSRFGLSMPMHAAASYVDASFFRSSIGPDAIWLAGWMFDSSSLHSETIRHLNY